MSHKLPQRLMSAIVLLLTLAGCATQPSTPAASAPAPMGLQQAWVQAAAGSGWVIRALTGEAE